MKVLVTVFCCAFLGLGVLDSTEAATLRCYYGSPSNFVDTPLDKPLGIISCLDKVKNTTMYVPGFQNQVDGPDVVEMVKALFTLGSTNVLLLNWEKESQGFLPNILGYPAATAAAKLVAITAGKSIVKLIENGISPNNVNIIGHSLGAHCAGWIGEEVQKHNYKIFSIYGLDPSNLLFEGKLGLDGLDPSRALYVYGLHTNAGEHGINQTVGIVDFWANCNTGSVQPGCPPGYFLPLNEKSLCSTHRSWKIFAEALVNPDLFPATAANSCTNWKYPTGILNNVGRVDPRKQGNFYFSTNAESPYGKRQAGLLPNPSA